MGRTAAVTEVQHIGGQLPGKQSAVLRTGTLFWAKWAHNLVVLPVAQVS